MQTQTEEQVKIEENQEAKEFEDKSALIVFNDDYNTFDFVIFCFMEVCKLTFEEAVERTFYIHNNGMGVVREGPYEEMNKMRKQLIDCGLGAIVQRINLT